MASLELKLMVESLKSQKSIFGGELSIIQQREGMEAMGRAIPVPDDVVVEPVDIDGIHGCWVTTPVARQDAYVVYFHGGGYVMGSLDSHKELMGRISRFCRATVLGVDYRLAPEHTYPAALDDALKSFQWLLKQDVDPSRIMLAGDSAGGGLALATLSSIRDAKGTLPAGAFLFSPWTDLTVSGESTSTRAQADPMIKVPNMLHLASLYCGGVSSSNPLISPLFADFSGFPPLLIQVGDAEVLLDDASRIANKAKAARVNTLYQVWDEAFHVFQAMPQLPESTEALQNVAAFYAEHVGA